MANGFTFFHSFYEAAQGLKEKERLQFYEAIINYSIIGEEPELCDVAKAMFLLVKPVLDKSREKSKSGKKGGEANTKQMKSKAEANRKQTGSKSEANVKQTVSKSKATAKQTASDISEDKDKEIEKDKEYITPHTPQGGDDAGSAVKNRFDLFWAAYPNKTGKGTAEKSWNKLRPTKELFSQIMEALQKAVRCERWVRENGRYIPNPATWLNQRRWEDEYTAPHVNVGYSYATSDEECPYGSFDTDDFFEAALRSTYGGSDE